MRAEKVKGNDLMLFIEGKSVAFATNHTLTLQRDVVDVTSKQSGGKYRAIKPRLVSWQLTSDNLYSDDDSKLLNDYMLSGTPVTCIFGRKQELYTPSLEDSDFDYWTPGTWQYWQGQAYITSLQVNSPTGEKATMSITLDGTGELTRNSEPPPADPVDD